jgi:hypothetical protein
MRSGTLQVVQPGVSLSSLLAPVDDQLDLGEGVRGGGAHDAVLVILVGGLVRDVREEQQVRRVTRRETDVFDLLVLLATCLGTDVLGPANLSGAGVVALVVGPTEEFDLVARTGARLEDQCSVHEVLHEVVGIALDDEAKLIGGESVHMHRTQLLFER